MQIADEADHVLRQHPTDSAGRVDGRPHGSVRGENETGRLQKPRIRIDERSGRRRNRVHIGAVADRELAMNKAARGIGGCPLGSLASELADRSESARTMLEHGFGLWESHLVKGLRAMRDRGALRLEAKPEDLATAVIAALQGGLLLAQTARTSRPLELALDMAINHIARLSS